MRDEEHTVRIEQLIEPVLHDYGLELVDFEWRQTRPRGLLRVFVDRPGGVAIHDCERVSRELGDLLDAEGVMAEAYDLEVSSPGLDRLLRKDREFRWAIGKRVRCVLGDGREVLGRLVAATEAGLVVEGNGERLELPRGEIAKARLEAEVPWRRKA
jgi:ribosome maturation factor RimP